MLLVLLCTAVTVDGNVKIVPIGDSITQGTVQNDDHQDHPTYRYWLWKQLQEGDYTVDFVGSSDRPRLPYDFDQDHEGHDGYRTRDFLANDRLKNWLSGYNPDIALVHLGTNDAMDGIPVESTISNLEEIIDILRGKNPDIVILMGTVIPRGGYKENLPALNHAIEGLVDRKSTATSPVVAVDLFSGYDGYDDNQPARYLHPNRQGEQKMADRYYAALIPFLSSDRRGAGTTPTQPTGGPTIVTPVPDPTGTPQTTPQPTQNLESLIPISPAQDLAPGVMAPQTEPVPGSPAPGAWNPFRGGSKQYLIGDQSFQSPAITERQPEWTPAFWSSGIGTWTQKRPEQRSFEPPTGLFIRWYPDWELSTRWS